MSFVGVDIGTQSLKAVVVDDELRVRGEASEAYEPEYPRPGWAQQDPAVWERALAPAIARARAAAGDPPVRALGIAGQLDGCVATDADGAARGPCLIWSDRRATAQLAGVDGDALRARTGVVLDASHMAAKAAWLGAAPRYHQPVSYLVARLTGEHVFDHGLASTTMAYALGARDFDDELLGWFGLARDALPRIARADACAGALTERGAALAGLPAGTPVAVGTGDDFATPLGAGIVAPGPVAVVLGTAEVVGAVHDAPVVDGGALVETHAYAAGGYFVENPGWLSGGAVAWLCRMLGVAGAAELDALAARAPAGAGGVAFLPALSGAMAPAWNADARACFDGLSAAHGREHVARALLEGCAFAMRDVVGRLGELGVRAEELVLLGGGAHSALWAQIRADVARLPAAVPARVDTCPVGAAMLAAVACGAYDDLASCAARVAGDRTKLDPGPSTYDEPYARYRELYARLYHQTSPPSGGRGAG